MSILHEQVHSAPIPVHSPKIHRRTFQSGRAHESDLLAARRQSGVCDEFIRKVGESSYLVRSEVVLEEVGPPPICFSPRKDKASAIRCPSEPQVRFICL